MRLDVAVRQQVTFQRRLLRKSRVARLALVRFHPTMNPHVDVETRIPRERRQTDPADVLLIASFSFRITLTSYVFRLRHLHRFT